MPPDHSVMEIRVLSPEHKQLKQVVDTKIKSPEIKRRFTLQSIHVIEQSLNYQVKIEKEDIEERTRLLKKAEEIK